MKKTIQINLQGRLFAIEEDAYLELKRYLDAIERVLAAEDSKEEILADIEMRISEVWANQQLEVISLQHVQQMKKKIGAPEEMSSEEQTEAEHSTHSSESEYIKKAVFRDVQNAVFGGVCSGLGHYFSFDKVLVRVLFLTLLFLSGGGVILVYAILWIIMPAAKTTSEKLQMRGKPVTFENIEKAVKTEYQRVKRSIEDYANREPLSKEASENNSLHRTSTYTAPAVERILLSILKVIGIIVIFGGAVLSAAALGSLISGLLTQFDFISIDGFLQYDLGLEGAVVSTAFYVLAFTSLIGIGLFLVLLGYLLFLPKKAGKVSGWLIAMGVLTLGLVTATFACLAPYLDS